MMPSTVFSRLSAGDLFEIEVQPSQRLVLGIDPVGDSDHAEILADQPVAWTARRDGRIIACFGIAEVFEGLHGVAWSILAEGIGSSHLEITRFARAQLDQCGLRRVELIAKGVDQADARAGVFTLVYQASQPTPEYRWARLLGFEPVHVLRHYGAASETCVLFERFPDLEACLSQFQESEAVSFSSACLPNRKTGSHFCWEPS